MEDLQGLRGVFALQLRHPEKFGVIRFYQQYPGLRIVGSILQNHRLEMQTSHLLTREPAYIALFDSAGEGALPADRHSAGRGHRRIPEQPGGQNQFVFPSQWIT